MVQERLGGFPRRREATPASTAALLHSERVPQSGPANSALRPSYTTGFSLSVLFVCVLCVCASKPDVSVEGL